MEISVVQVLRCASVFWNVFRLYEGHDRAALPKFNDPVEGHARNKLM